MLTHAFTDTGVKKFDDHLPLNRISEIYLRDGKVSLSKQTLSDWVLSCASWLTPLCEALKKALLQESVIHVDETALPLLHPLKAINARAWVYVGGGGKLLRKFRSVRFGRGYARCGVKGWRAGQFFDYCVASGRLSRAFLFAVFAVINRKRYHSWLLEL